MIPQKKFAKHQVPWIANNIKRLSRKKQKKYNLARRTNTDENQGIYLNLKRRSPTTISFLTQLPCSILIRPTQQMHKEFWKCIKSVHKDQVSINTLQVDEKPYSDSLSKTDILNNYFSYVFTKDNQSLLLTSAVSQYLQFHK